MAQLKLTPMLRQYLEIKERYPDAILFYRMGDFYEMFFEDAQVASRILEITLTSRDKGKEHQVPMCGVPVHAAEGYLRRLVEAGHRVAICEQVEDPREAKGLVRREVVRVVTPGLMVEGGDHGEAGGANYIAAVAPGRVWGLARLDLSTGEFALTQAADLAELQAELARVDPAELLLPEGEEGVVKELAGAMDPPFTTFRPASWFRPQRAREVLTRHFGVATLDGFGVGPVEAGIGAAGALLAYVEETQRADLSHIDRLRPYLLADHMVIDDSTRRNLELVANLYDQGRRGSLLHCLDRTRTAMGARLLRQWLLYPLKERRAMEERHGAVERLMDPGLLEELGPLLDRIYDIHRLLSRLVMGSANGRDLLALKSSLEPVGPIRELLEGRLEGAPFLQRLQEMLDPLPALTDLISRAIREECPVSVREGNMIREGFHPEIDQLARLQRSSREVLAELEAREREATGIPSLKVGYNRVFGYYLEVTKAHLSKVPDRFIRKQTLANAERYITQELKELEERIVHAQERRVELEYQVFLKVRQEVVERHQRIKATAEGLALLDVLASLAQVALERGYVRPEMTDEDRLEIVQGRHPVVELQLPPSGFVPNDIRLDRRTRMAIITGPNMAGKSTVLRQTALICLMAQMGSFVPADRAVLGVVDRIFTRVGATDYLVRGQSTFMVEMSETAQILRNATSRSLVILDEIGRGTSTFDGLAIAWAVAEALLRLDGRGVKTLFATHYHELTELAERFPGVENLHIGVREEGGRVVFLHQLLPGPTGKSYGIEVAALAGVPRPVIERAQELLAEIEAGARPASRGRGGRVRQQALPLVVEGDSEIRRYLQGIEIDRTTPLEALNHLAKLKALVKNG